MKKSLLGLLLAVLLVGPAFAAKGDMSINGKLGLGLNNNFNLIASDGMFNLKEGFKMNMPVSLGAEFFYEAIDSLSVGAGVNYTFNSNSKFEQGGQKIEAGVTNIYLAVKPEAKIDSKIFSSFYLVGQIGLSMFNVEWPGAGSLSTDSGLYLGIGAGATIANQVLVELICSSSNGSISDDEMGAADLQYTAVTLNVGYKFSL